ADELFLGLRIPALILFEQRGHLLIAQHMQMVGRQSADHDFITTHWHSSQSPCTSSLPVRPLLYSVRPAVSNWNPLPLDKRKNGPSVRFDLHLHLQLLQDAFFQPRD